MSYESPFVDSPRQQMFPVLEAAELERVRRLGTIRSFANGEYLARAGERSQGLMVVLAGNVTVYRRDITGAQQPIVTYGRGGFFGGLAQITGRPSLVDAQAERDVSVLLLVPERLRALLIGEAQLGERILRALILRRLLSHCGGCGHVASDKPNTIVQSTLALTASCSCSCGEGRPDVWTTTRSTAFPFRLEMTVLLTP